MTVEDKEPWCRRTLPGRSISDSLAPPPRCTAAGQEVLRPAVLVVEVRIFFLQMAESGSRMLQRSIVAGVA